MATNVSAEETKAILDLVQPGEAPAEEISARDFGAPRRLSAAQIAKLSRVAQASLHEIEAHLALWLRSPHTVQIAAIVESDARTVVTSLVDPFSVLAFDAAGQMGFVVWEMGALVAAVEIALGSGDVKETKPRAISTVESKVLAAILTRVAQLVTTALGVETKNPRVVSELQELARWDEVPGADAQRVCVQLAIQGTAGASTLRVYVPGVKPPTAAATTPAKAAKVGPLPPHLASIEVELRAEVGTVEVPLQDLLSLEVGDVLRLTTKVGDLLQLRAEGEPCARAELGQHEGRLVLRIHSIESRNDTGSRG